ncbi:MAG: flagellar hook capping protein [Hyphomicrobiales bacterium]|nr:MAG: flagellar hook capping protein [Hyphomicrobiales bacterium]
MSIASVAESVAGKSPTSVSSKSTIADNFDIFLNLLTTQLKNQNPLDPVKTNEFTQQLVQFAQVEQQVKTNDNLKNIADLYQESTLSSTVSYIGKTVTAEGDVTKLEGNGANWDVKFDDDPNETTITISNSSGKTIYTDNVNFNIGSNTYAWNGENDFGNPQANGLYTIKVSATNNDGKTIKVSTMTTGVVTGVDMTGNIAVLNIGDRTVKLENIQKIEA